ncbi:MAG TPA: class F sortase, partial [Actinomycetales bacterium]|nr:class F sortase [Actinomycetales bacterium]
GGELDPPTLDEAYWIETYGTPGSDADNTVYLAGHSYDSGDAAFNPLFDRAEQIALVGAGDEIVVTTDAGRLTYAVDSTERYPKDELAGVDEVWKIVPDRLVLITCFQRNDGGASQDNLVVFASLVSTAPA